MRNEHALGSANEMIAAAYYLKNGYEVFWPAVQQSDTDFLISKDGFYTRVQVKTAYWNRSGRNNYLQCRVSRKEGNDLPIFDILVVVGDGELWEFSKEEVTKKCLTLRNDNTGEIFYPSNRKTH